MPSRLHELIERARAIRMTPDEAEEQRRTFAYGNTHIENEDVTRETIDAQAESLKADRR